MIAQSILDKMGTRLSREEKEKHKKLFESLDTDGDGFITEEELVKNLGKDSAEHFLNGMDKNNDGKITFQELLEHQKKVKKEARKSVF